MEQINVFCTLQVLIEDDLTKNQGYLAKCFRN